MTTISDIARAAGVSNASVSRYFNSPALLADDTRRRIEDTVLSLGYGYSASGRGRRKMKTGRILVMLPTVSNPMYQKILSVIDEKCHAAALSVFVCVSGNEEFRERELLTSVANGFADGAILFSSKLSGEELDKFASRIPLVRLLEDDGMSTKVPGASVDDRKAAYDVVRHFIGNGHRRIALINGMSEYASTAKRENGYLDALKSAFIEYRPEYVRYGKYGFSSGKTAMRELLALDEPPTAVFAVSDAMAIGAIQAAREAGKRVGRDLAVVGFDDTSLASEYDPALSSVHQPREAMATAAVGLLMERMKNKGFSRNVILDHTLKIRQSSDFIFKGEVEL